MTSRQVKLYILDKIMVILYNKIISLNREVVK